MAVIGETMRMNAAELVGDKVMDEIKARAVNDIDGMDIVERLKSYPIELIPEDPAYLWDDIQDAIAEIERLRAAGFK